MGVQSWHRSDATTSSTYLSVYVMFYVLCLEIRSISLKSSILLQGGPKSGPQTHDHNSVKSEPM